VAVEQICDEDVERMFVSDGPPVDGVGVVKVAPHVELGKGFVVRGDFDEVESGGDDFDHLLF
jgi:hypothetical protein